MTEIIILGCLSLAMGLLGYAALRRRYLLGLYALCYSVPFLGLSRALWADQVIIWPIGNYTFDDSAEIVFRLSVMWLTGLCGMLGTLLSISLVPKIRLGNLKLIAYDEIDVKVVAWLFFALSILYISVRVLYADKALGAFTGVESFAIYSIIVFFAYALRSRKRKLLAAGLTLAIFYSYANSRTGDRDFVVLLIAMILGAMYLYSELITLRKLSFVILGMATLLGAGIYVSMERLNVAITESSISQYFLYNSWNAIILPVIDQLTNHWNGDHTRFGQTYVDMLLSAAPSPVYAYFGMVKPIALNNPADWYYIVGLGGMHAAGVGFENFGLPGVFIDAAVSMLLVRLLDQANYTDSYLRYLTYMLCAASVMHWLWYGAIYMLNAMVFVGSLAALLITVSICRQLLLKFTLPLRN